MSGKPNPEGVKQLSGFLRELNDAQETIRRLKKVVNDQLGAIEREREREKAALEGIEESMRAMDVHAPGNFGYEDRLLWLLRELSRQAERSGAAGDK